MKELLSHRGVTYGQQDMIKEPPSKEILTWVASQLPNKARDLLNPVKIEKNDPYYVAHIKGQEETLSEADYIDIYYRFPDLLKKPILTDGSKFLLGYDETELAKVFGSANDPDYNESVTSSECGA